MFYTTSVTIFLNVTLFSTSFSEICSNNCVKSGGNVLWISGKARYLICQMITRYVAFAVRAFHRMLIIEIRVTN